MTERAKRAENKINRAKQTVLFYLESHELTKLETDRTTLRRRKNSQDSVIIANDSAVPAELRQYDLKVDGTLWVKLFSVLPKDLAAALGSAVKSSEPMFTAIKQYFMEGNTLEGVQVKRRFHLRIG